MTISVLTVSVLLFSSCDALRRLAGRPTSDEIEAKRIVVNAEREAAHAREIALADSLKAVSDSLDALKALADEGYLLHLLSGFQYAPTKPLEDTYYIIIGAFRSETYSGIAFNKAKAAGYEPCYIVFENGLRAVSVANCSRITDALVLRRKVASEPFVPKEAWILANR